MTNNSIIAAEHGASAGHRQPGAPLRRVAVYCASNDGAKLSYVTKARTLGALLAARGITVVYGGGRTGLMGALADGAIAAGGDVIGVMPHGLVEREVAHRGISTLHVVDSMHERKALITELADAFVTMPGGIGTLEEFFETWTWATLGVHRKPVGLLDTDEFWNPLMALLDQLEGEGFLRGSPRDWLLRDEDPARLLDRLGAYEPPVVRRWLHMRET
jgi:uncharacterized protein (TIGR00730 family)